ncbi:SDR family oxidoreductase [Magnetococcus sp. PR-3]|uniref:SDR family oxidoreductase n=1 Tax=Magnetococcus sp. PR-3 TaxID=3120355 RepID=UPI002FCE29CB
MARSLIIGASGFIGQQLYRRLGAERCVGTYAHTPFAGGVAFDPTTTDPALFLDQHGPFEHIYVLMAMSSLVACAEDPARAHAINVDAVLAIARWCQQHQTPLLFSSSDAVFDGENAPYNEQHQPTPLVTYGKQKREVECYLQAHMPELHTTVRLSKTYSSDPEDGTLLSAWAKAWQQGQAITCATDQRFNPIHVADAVEAMVQLMAGQHRGLYHLCGPTSVNRYELMLQLKKAYEARLGPLPSWDITTCLINDFGFSEPWPIDISTQIDKLLATLPLTPRTPAQGCEDLVSALLQHQSNP